jgi:hypothetical protein
MPTLTVTDLRDPAPPVPGPAHRAAVAVRAKQLNRRRRFAQIGGACAVIAVLAVGGVAVASSSGTDQPGRVVAAQLASVRGSTTTTPVSTLTVTFTGNEKTVTVDADPSGTFTISDLPPGDYLVVWKYETSGPAPSGGVDIGTALSGGRMHVNLSSGTNTVSIPLTN